VSTRLTSRNFKNGSDPSGPREDKIAPAQGADCWRWQLRHAVRTAVALGGVLQLSPGELSGAQAAERQRFPLAITPYYLSLCDPDNSICPIRRQVVPSVYEQRAAQGDWIDPLGERAHQVAAELIRRYPDRAVLLVNSQCATYCRFCTRKRWVGQNGGPRSPEQLSAAFAYLRSHPEIREVILSGGDPLIMTTEKLGAILAELRGIDSIETIRIASRAPVVLPQRITAELMTELRRYHPLWMMTHFNHPRELTPEARAACHRLADAGLPVMNQTVLLRGVNDNAETLSHLFRQLIRERVRPYYLLQCDPVQGSSHLRTPIDTGPQLMRELQGKLSGIALPKLIVDTPGGHGKVPLCPDYVVSRQPGVTRFRSPFGIEVDYFDPPT
jgi:lysine 2,3-aminomutase